MLGRLLKICVPLLVFMSLLAAAPTASYPQGYQPVTSRRLQSPARPFDQNHQRFLYAVSGAVREPGFFEFSQTTLRLKDLVERAGGLTDQATGSIRLIRDGHGQQFWYEHNQHLLLLPRDFVEAIAHRPAGIWIPRSKAGPLPQNDLDVSQPEVNRNPAANTPPSYSPEVVRHGPESKLFMLPPSGISSASNRQTESAGLGKQVASREGEGHSRAIPARSTVHRDGRLAAGKPDVRGPALPIKRQSLKEGAIRVPGNETGPGLRIAVMVSVFVVVVALLSVFLFRNGMHHSPKKLSVWLGSLVNNELSVTQQDVSDLEAVHRHLPELSAESLQAGTVTTLSSKSHISRQSPQQQLHGPHVAAARHRSAPQPAPDGDGRDPKQSPSTVAVVQEKAQQVEPHLQPAQGNLEPAKNLQIDAVRIDAAVDKPLKPYAAGRLLALIEKLQSPTRQSFADPGKQTNEARHTQSLQRTFPKDAPQQPAPTVPAASAKPRQNPQAKVVEDVELQSPTAQAGLMDRVLRQLQGTKDRASLRDCG